MHTPLTTYKTNKPFLSSSFSNDPFDKPALGHAKPALNRSQSQTLNSEKDGCSMNISEFTTKDGNTRSEVEFWRQSYLQLKQIHKQTVNELNSQLERKDEELMQLKRALNMPDRMIKSQTSDYKSIQKTASVRNEHPDETFKGLQFQFEDSIVDSINPREQDLENQLVRLNSKIEEMEIEKMYNQIKEEEWMASNLRVEKEIKRYRSKEEVERMEKAVNTEGGEERGRIDGREFERNPVQYLKTRLLRLMEANVKLTRQLHEESEQYPTKSTISTPSKLQQSSKIALAKIFSNPLDLSRLGEKKNSSYSDRLQKEKQGEKADGVNKAFSPFMTPTKQSLSSRSNINKERWVVLKRNLEDLKKENKVLMNYMEMKGNGRESD